MSSAEGGEELEMLVQSDIPFEAVPGITSSVAVPAYAAYRDPQRLYLLFSCNYRACQKDGKLSIDFDSLVRLNGTLVFLMSVSSMEKILRGLLDAGMDRICLRRCWSGERRRGREE